MVDWTDASVDLNGLACFAERWDLVSVHVPSHFKHSLHIHTHIIMCSENVVCDCNMQWYRNISGIFSVCEGCSLFNADRLSSLSNEQYRAEMCPSGCSSIYLSQCGVLQATQDILSLLSISGCRTSKENCKRRSFRLLADVDNLLKTRHTQCHVLGRHTGKMESVECHLRGRFSQWLSCQGSYHLTRTDLKHTNGENCCIRLKIGLNVPWTMHHDINFEAITSLMHKYVYSYSITILYMFWALLCSSSGGSIVCVQHLVLSLSVSGRMLHWLRENWMATHREWRYQMLYIYNWTSWRWA